jgi:hypothetical protein
VYWKFTKFRWWKFELTNPRECSCVTFWGTILGTLKVPQMMWQLCCQQWPPNSKFCYSSAFTASNFHEKYANVSSGLDKAPNPPPRRHGGARGAVGQGDPQTHTVIKFVVGVSRIGFPPYGGRQYSNTGHSELISGTACGTKIWHVKFANIVKIGLYFLHKGVLWR